MSKMAKKSKAGRPKQDAAIATARNDEILDRATEMFARNGYQNTDIEVLANELGIGKGTIYRAFESKQLLFFATLSRGLDRLSDYITAQTSVESESIKRIAVSIKAYLRFFDENPNLVELFIQERAEFKDRTHSTYFEHRRRNLSKWSAFMSELMERGYVRKMSPEWLVDTLNQLLFGQIFLKHYYRPEETLVSKSDDLLAFFLTGILTPAGVQATGFGDQIGG